MPKVNRTRNVLKLKDKVIIINEIENGKTQAQVCKERKLPTSTVQDIYKKKVDILAHFAVLNPNVKKVKKCAFPAVENALLEWFEIQRSRKIPIDGPLLQEKARKFAEDLNVTGFTASAGWLDKWKKRHGIKFCQISGEAAAVDMSVVDTWLTDIWPTICDGYQPENIFNADETGLFYKLLPNKTFNRKGQLCNGGKLSKERLTVLLGSNADGTEKLNPVVIGKYENPRCFKTIKKKSLPVDYQSNAKAWMTQDIFTTWLRKIDLKYRFARRKILLLVDNCQPHKVYPNLSNVKLVFMPPNVTSVLQPFDLGIIKETKKNYRRVITRKIIDRMDSNERYEIDVLEAVMNISTAWNSVPAKTIEKCFNHSKLISKNDEMADVEEVPLNNDAELMERLGLDNDLLNEYYTVDDNVVTYEIPSDEQIVEAVQQQNMVQEIMEDSEGEDDPVIERQEMSVKEAAACMERLKLCIMSHENKDSNALKSVAYLEDYLLNLKLSGLRQSTITEFFTSNSE